MLRGLCAFITQQFPHYPNRSTLRGSLTWTKHRCDSRDCQLQGRRLWMPKVCATFTE